MSSVPDVQIFPHATGAAEKTVQQHSDPQELVFWSGWFCPYVQRSWIVLEEKGIPYQYKEVNPYKKEKHFLDINPKGLVPALEYKGQPLYESLIISEFLEENYPNYGKPLLPSDPFARAQARLWIDHINKFIIPNYMRLIQSQPDSEPTKVQTALEDLVKAQKTLAEKVQGPYFFGDNWSLVDAALAPWIVRDFVPREHRGYKRSLAGSKWESYAEALENRDSVIKTFSERKHLEAIYARYLRNEAQSEAAKAIREGRPIP